MKKRKWILVSLLLVAVMGTGACSSGNDAVEVANLNQQETLDEKEPEMQEPEEPIEEILIEEEPEEEVIEEEEIDIHAPYGDIRGIYVSAHRAGGVRDDGSRYIDSLVEIANTTPVNAMVIDIKDDLGNVTVRNKIPIADEYGVSRRLIPDIDGLMEQLKENDIYPIARVVLFKDSAIAESHPEYMIKSADGSLYKDNGGNHWVNPYVREAWAYNIEIAKGAVELGFKEIQFDYIRFVADARLDETNLGDMGGISKEEIILEFVDYAMAELKPLGVRVSADVYGTVIGSAVDAGIVGQNYVELAKRLDVICPMVYPSHYAQGEFGIPEPDAEPYKIILGAMNLSNQKLSVIPEGEHRAIVRPWLQDFTDRWLERKGRTYQVYGDEQRQDQIRAVYEAGLSEWLLWDAGVDYRGGGYEVE